MGIRFECPNGHRLHVKAFLVGKRGICPECDARFIVPVESGGQASAVEEGVVEEGASPTEVANSATVAPPLPGAELPLPEADLSLPDVWYIRSAGGEQYGPADTETMRGWAAEGRVSRNSWVWRTGWPDWKKGVDALALFNASSENVATSIPTTPIDVAAPKLRRNRRSSRRERAKKVTVALSVLVVLLLLALALVLSR